MGSVEDRYHGVNDPAAKRIMDRVTKALVPPEDKTITTLYIGGVKHPVTEEDIRLVSEQDRKHKLTVFSYTEESLVHLVN